MARYTETQDSMTHLLIMTHLSSFFINTAAYPIPRSTLFLIKPCRFLSCICEYRWLLYDLYISWILRNSL